MRRLFRKRLNKAHKLIKQAGLEDVLTIMPIKTAFFNKIPLEPINIGEVFDKNFKGENI